MSKDNLQTVFLDLGCFPHQAEFAAKFLAPDSAQKHLLVSSAGLGKGFAGSAIVSYAVTHGHARRVLILAPVGILVHQWLDMIRRNNPDVRCMIVDRRRLRELEDEQKESESLWPSSGIVVMSLDFAKRADVSDSITQAEWDLLVVDEAQHLTPPTQRYQFVTRLLEHSPDLRTLFLRVQTLPRTDIDDSTDPLFCDSEATVWSRETVRDKDGKPLLPEVHIEWVTHHRRDDEVKLLSQLQNVLKATQGSSSQSQFEATMLLQTASSSLFALEQRLNRMRQQRNEFAHGVSEFTHRVGNDDELLLDEIDSEQPSNGLSLAQSKFIKQTGELLEMLDDVDTDSKFESLLALLDNVGVLNNGDRRVCVFTSFVDTATYLESALSEHHPSVGAITGSLSFSEREQAVAHFAHNGGILVVTSAMLTNIPEVAAVIFYDLPLNPRTIDAHIGQFVRVGRTGPVRVFAFTDESDTLIIERLQRKMAEFKDGLVENDIQSYLFPKGEPTTKGQHRK